MAVRAVNSRTPERNRRPDIEKGLIDAGISFAYQEGVSVERFDAERSLRNQARLGNPLDESTVKKYLEALYNGDIFPPLLAERSGDLLTVLDGNHRLRAHAEAGLPVDVYVCEASPQVLVMLTFTANAKHGLPSKVEDRLHHALFLMDSGVPLTEAAAKLGVSKNELRRAQTKQNSARRADDNGIPRREWESLHPTIRSRLTNIHTDEGFRAAFQLVKVAGMGADETFQLVAQLNESRSGKRQAAVVAAMRNDMAERIAEVNAGGAARTGYRNRSPRQRLGSALGMVLALPPLETYEAEPFPEQFREDLAQRIDAATDRLIALRNLL